MPTTPAISPALTLVTSPATLTATPVVAFAATAFVLGLAVGSFLNVVAHRVPLGLSLSRPGSHCPRCEAPIRARHNVPVLGWVALRGRCADCSEPISWRYPVVELATGVAFALLSLRVAQLGLWSALPAILWFAALGIALALIDLDTGRLPDRLVLPAYPVLAVLLTCAALVGGDTGALVRAGVGAVASFAGFYLLAVAKPGGMGFGDVKTAGLVGGVLAFVSYGVLLVGLLAGFVLGAAAAVLAMAASRATRRSLLPFGPFMVAGAFASLLVGAPIAHTYARLFLSA